MIQFISHYSERYSYLDSIQLALEGGCRWIQLRMKDATDNEVRPIAIKAQQLCRQYHATFIIDDRVALVRELGADGVHLGKNDMPIREARQLLGPESAAQPTLSRTPKPTTKPQPTISVVAHSVLPPQKRNWLPS